MPTTSDPQHCYCGNDKPFSQCCEPFITMQQKPKSVRQLVRARYCAYALGAGRHREFLIRTWHPATARQVSLADLSNDSLIWLALEIIHAEQKGDMGRVEFKARYKQGEDGAIHVHHERSLFQRLKGVWLYLEGQVREE